MRIAIIGRDFVLAYRNVLRNKRRSLLTSLVLIIGVLSLCLFGYYNESIHYYFGNSIIAQRGHFQVFEKGYLNGDASSLENAITPEESEAAREILRKYLPDATITERLYASGLIGNETGSTVFVGTGIRVENELNLMSLAYNSLSFSKLKDVSNILIGKTLMERMKLEKGQGSLLLAMTETGSMGAVNSVIADSVETGMSYSDETIVIANLENLQQLMNTDKVHVIVVRLDDLIDKKSNEVDPALIAGIQEDFDKRGLNLEMKTWIQLDTMYASVVRLFESIFVIVYIILLLVIVITMTNAVFMSVMERVNEVGTLMAIGSSKIKILRTFVAEGFILSLFSAIAGVLLSVFVAYTLNRMNILLPPYPGQSVSYPITFLVKPSVMLVSGVFIVVGSVISSVFPAMKAIRMKPVDALRYT